MYMWPSIMYENDDRYQLDVTIMIYYRKYIHLTWYFSDRASWIDYILITNFCALIITREIQ